MSAGVEHVTASSLIFKTSFYFVALQLAQFRVGCSASWLIWRYQAAADRRGPRARPSPCLAAAHLARRRRL